MPSYKIKHITRYAYPSPVIDCTNQIMLYPIFDAHLEVRKQEILITGNPPVEVFLDHFGNRVGMFSLIKPHEELIITSEADVITKPINLPTHTGNAQEQWTQLRSLKSDVAFFDFLHKEEFEGISEVKELVGTIANYNKLPFENAIDLSTYIYNNLEYKKGVTDVLTKTDEVWKLKAGVCQDFAHLLLVMIRMIGIPARYVSGYICPKDQEEQRGEGATHAWVEVWIPLHGWVGVDPTNNCVVNDGHVRLAVGRSFTDCTPVKGTYKGSGDHYLEVRVDIENGIPRKKKEKEKEFSPVFHAPPTGDDLSLNSYRRFLELKQRQQQQQQ
jgi:transglutaminase-like putative cysteine protease